LIVPSFPSCRALCAMFSLLLLTLPAAGQARSTGNIYFADPSVAIAEGGSGEVELRTYAGPLSFGLLQLQLNYAASELQVAGIDFGDDARLQGFISRTLRDGSDGAILMSEQLESSPLLGELSLARIQVSPELPAGSSIQLEVSVVAMQQRDGQDYPISLSFPLEITVTSPTAGPQGELGSDGEVEAPLVMASAEEWARIGKLYPVGGVVRLMRRAWRGNQFLAWPVRIDTESRTPRAEEQ